MAFNVRREESRRAVLAACRRLAGVRELTAAALADATGLGLDTCRVRRGELLEAGLIAMTWRDLSARGAHSDFGVSSRDHRAIRARVAKVRAVKRRIGGGEVPAHVLDRILPA